MKERGGSLWGYFHLWGEVKQYGGTSSNFRGLGKKLSGWKMTRKSVKPANTRMVRLKGIMRHHPKKFGIQGNLEKGDYAPT